MEILVKYHDPELIKIEKIKVGDWIDLRSAEDVSIEEGEFKLISLGVSIKLPEGYFAELAPRSSTFKNYGIMQTNSIGIIDESYCGNDDIWKMPVYCVKGVNHYYGSSSADGIHYNRIEKSSYSHIKKNDRIAQFRIVKKMEDFDIKEVDDLGDSNRGGFGSTGKE